MDPVVIVAIIIVISAVGAIASALVRGSATGAADLEESPDAAPPAERQARGTRSGPESPNGATIVLMVSLAVLVVALLVLIYLLLT